MAGIYLQKVVFSQFLLLTLPIILLLLKFRSSTVHEYAIATTVRIEKFENNFMYNL